MTALAPYSGFPHSSIAGDSSAAAKKAMEQSVLVGPFFFPPVLSLPCCSPLLLAPLSQSAVGNKDSGLHPS